jgi:hypothetical protein
MSVARSAISRLGLGRIFYYAWHAPAAQWSKRRREGWINTGLSSLGRYEMEKAAASLTPRSRKADGDAAVYFLSGKKFWYQTLFCAYSLAVQTDDRISTVVLDDGTLTEENADVLMRVLGNCKVVWRREIEAQLDQHLPAWRFPALRARRLEYPHIGKLTDVHAGRTGWNLVLDSDMLFHGRPAFLESWLHSPKVPLHMRDIVSSYGYSETLMSSLAGAQIPELVNVGICGLRSDAIDWEKLELWCRELLAREGSHYLQEQALVAMLLAGGPHLEAPPADAVVAPSRAESLAPSAALHHYVAESKAWYFRFAWRRAFERNGSS